jgi:hypothetical protein
LIGKRSSAVNRRAIIDPTASARSRIQARDALITAAAAEHGLGRWPRVAHRRCAGIVDGRALGEPRTRKRAAGQRNYDRMRFYLGVRLGIVVVILGLLGFWNCWTNGVRGRCFLENGNGRGFMVRSAPQAKMQQLILPDTIRGFFGTAGEIT